tara:strand:- start:3432 stop:3578 length:147 start_codon:yes stop_codon:yes gene_type:complete
MRRFCTAKLKVSGFCFSKEPKIMGSTPIGGFYPFGAGLGEKEGQLNEI